MDSAAVPEGQMPAAVVNRLHIYLAVGEASQGYRDDELHRVEFTSGPVHSMKVFVAGDVKQTPRDYLAFDLPQIWL